MRKTDNTSLFSFLGLALVVFGWLALLLAYLGFFQRWLLLLGALGLLAVFFYLSFQFWKKSRFSWDFSLAIILSVITILVFAHYSVPTVFTGRDQGSLSSAAISLAENHSLYSSFPAEKEFFNIYGPGRALNFPGFYYTSDGTLTTQFPTGYIAWLAALYIFFGLSGLIVANALSFFLFLISFYSLAKIYLKNNAALIAFLLVVTSFIFSWFFKFTLSENLALGLLWFGLVQFLLFWKDNKRLNFLAFLLSFGLLLFVRIETFAFLSVAIGALCFRYRQNRKVLKKIFIQPAVLAVLALILISLIISFFIDHAFYVTFLKGFLNSFGVHDANDVSSGIYPFAGIFYILRILGIYALLTYILLGLIALGYFWRKKDFEKLLPYFILLPSFIYLINPSISPDHPWMLRRYEFAIVPISILYSIIFLKDFLKKDNFFYVFSFFLLLTNLMIFSPLLKVKENPTLLSQIDEISQNFGSKDLVLVDRDATGNPWAMMAGPLNLLFGKQAVYFFNPNDLDKLELSNFQHIYFIIPDNKIDFYRESGLLNRFITVKSYSLENFSLNEVDLSKQDRYNNPVLIPPYLKNYIYGKIYLLRQS